MERPVVALDESGNTGGNLVDTAQPVFVHASVCLSSEEVSRIRRESGIADGDELHFDVLRNSALGRSKVLKILDSGVFTQRTAKTVIYHKPYMTVGKSVDMLLETLAYSEGMNIYAGAQNIHLADLLYEGLPSSCDKRLFEQFLKALVTMVRRKRREYIEEFYRIVRMLGLACRDDELLMIIDILLATEKVIDDALLDVGVDELDPAIPGFIQLATIWSQKLRKVFEIHHDRSRALERAKVHLEACMSVDRPADVLGCGERKFGLSIRCTGVRFMDSRTSTQIQMADLIAGATRHLASGLSDVSRQDWFWEQLMASCVRDLVADTVWPSRDHTLDQLAC